MSELVTWFDPPPARSELPASLPSPFDPGPPHPLARRAADELMDALRAGLVADAGLDAPGGGKMFGVLVVAGPGGRVGYLRAFSGMLGGRWHVDGFVPPLFDLALRDRFWPAGEAELRAIDARLAALAAAPERVALAELAARHAAEQDQLRARHRLSKGVRHEVRARIAGSALEPEARRTATHALDQESRRDGAERRQLDQRHAAERAALGAAVRALDEEAAALAEAKAARSRHYLHRIHETYTIPSARGATRPLRALFAPDEPPGGAGDCSGPKLLGEAYRRGLRPLALAEVWWGAPPATGGRVAGHFYPACRGKCGRVLPYMLDGLLVDPAPLFGTSVLADDEPRLVFEDAWLVVVDKPCGLLSVPGRHAALRDCVQSRLRRRYPDATGPLVVHRLDLDTSGLLLAARDEATHAALQRQFARREIDKRYLAWVDGAVAGEAGTIDLPLRVDLDDRPRQVVDPVHGKPAVTAWRVVARAGARTLVAMHPRTGRTHQLRVHAAHPRGLGAPIVGDRLYGRGGPRLLLHAEALGFVHPHTGARLELERPAPFAGEVPP